MPVFVSSSLSAVEGAGGTPPSALAPVQDAWFWRLHFLFPALAFAAAVLLLEMTSLDLKVADGFFDAALGLFPARNSFIAETLMHRGGSNLIRLIAVISLLSWLGSFRLPALRPWRRAAGYLLLCIACGTGLVGLGKRYSNVDCPWDLDRYSGDRPYLNVFADRHDALPQAHCFPGGHSSGAFSLFGFYFLLRGHKPRAARLALIAAGLLGCAFAAGQWVRGAHFPSHDLWSAFLCWNVVLALYVLLLRGRAASPLSQ